MEQQPKQTPDPAAPAATATGPDKPSAPEKKKRPNPPRRKKRRRPSPVPVSMWLLPRLRLPFASPLEFLRWFVTGINFWAVGAVILCAVAGWALLERFSQPRQLGVEQALAGGEGTRGLTYIVERTGENEVTVTGTWDPEKEQEEPDPRLAAALCAALSPEEIYGHSDHLYRAIASRFFQGEDFDLTILLRRAMDKKDEEEPEPLFSITRPAGADDWPQPDCDAVFAKQWREAYHQYWLFGQGRKEEMGPPQSDPIFEEGDRPPESGEESSEEEAPPLPDLDGASSQQTGDPAGEQEGDGAEESSSSPPEEPSSGSSSGSDGGSSADGEPVEPPEGWLERLVAYAARYRGLSWKEAWELFRESREE